MLGESFSEFIVLIVASVYAAPSSTPKVEDSPTFEESYTQVLRLLAAQRYEAAIADLDVLHDDEPENADVLNLLGYSHRKLEKFDEAQAFYSEALELAPLHLGANEYLGELYLQTNEPKKAQAQRDILEEACAEIEAETKEDTCKALDSLTAAITAYEAGEYDAFVAAQEDDFANIW